MSVRHLIERDTEQMLGRMNFIRFGTSFPLLIKLIDAADHLSVQVHPDDEMALAMGHPRGKTEMWYVLDTNPGATLTVGFNCDMDPAEVLSKCEDGSILQSLNSAVVSAGDVFFIPAGTVHSIGAGCFLIEVQQASDDTFRIYDYGRGRPLHQEQALRALRLTATDGRPVPYTAHADIPVNVVRSPYFSTNVMTIDQSIVRDYSECDSFVAIMAAEGHATVTDSDGSWPLTKGELGLIPAKTDNITIQPHGRFTAVEVYIKQ